MTPGTTITPVAYGKSFTIEVTGGKIDSVDNLTETSNDGTTYVGEFKPAADVEDGATVEVTVNFEVPTFGLPDKDKSGTYTLKYYIDADMTTPVDDSSAVPEGTDVYVEVTGASGDKYVDSVTIDGSALTAQSSGSFGPYKVTATVEESDVEVTVADKTVSVEVVCQYEDGTSADDRVDVYYNSAVQGKTVADVKNGEFVTPKALGGAKIKSVSGSNMTCNTSLPETYADCKIDVTSLNNGDTVTITVELARPSFTLPDKSKNGIHVIKFYKDAAMTDGPITSIEEGQEVYVIAEPNDTKTYVSQMKIKDKALTAQSSGAFGPYKVTEAIEQDDVSVIVAAKKVTLAITCVDTDLNSAEDLLAVSHNSVTAGMTVSNVMESSSVVLKTTGVTFVSVSGDSGITATKNSDEQYTCTFDFTSVKDGDTLNLKVILQK